MEVSRTTSNFPFYPIGKTNGYSLFRSPRHTALEEVHPTDEISYEPVRRPGIDFEGGSDLRNLPLVHHHDPIRSWLPPDHG